MTSAEDVLAKAKGRVEKVRLLFDDSMLDEHEQLERQLAEATEREDEPGYLRSIAEQIIELEQAMAAEEIEFTFTSVGRGTWRSLIADHPDKDGEQWDGDEFPFVAMEASLVEPKMTADELKELADRISLVQFERLWAGCLMANIGGSASHPESRAALATLANGRRKSVQPSNSEFPERS